MSFARSLVGIVGLVCVGCASTCGEPRSGTEGQIGELGNGDFVHGCLDRTDAACQLEESPDCIATGSRFEVNYQLLDPSAIATDIDPVLQVVAANEDFLGLGQPFLARRSGRTAVLARESGHIIDLLHLDLMEATEIEIVTEAGEVIGDRLELARGATTTLFVRPRVEGCFVAGGALPLTVRRNVGLMRAVVGVDASDVLVLEGLAMGTLEVNVNLGELTRTLTIDVIDGPLAETSTTTDVGSSSSSESGSATDTDTDTSATDTDTDTDTDTGGG
jgi:hypothetical protein